MSVVKKDFGIESGGSIPGMMDRGAPRTVTCQCEDSGFFDMYMLKINSIVLVLIDFTSHLKKYLAYDATRLQHLKT